MARKMKTMDGNNAAAWVSYPFTDLAAIYPITPSSPMAEVTFLDKEDHADNVSDKGIIYDLYCRTASGEYIIVEMQNRWHSNFLDRTLYYVCRAVSRQIESPSSKEVPVPEDSMTVREPLVAYGKQYRLPTIYGIFLMNFKEENLEAKFRTDTVLSDRDTGKIVNPHLRQIYLQFPYFAKDLSDCHTSDIENL